MQPASLTSMSLPESSSSTRNKRHGPSTKITLSRPTSSCRGVVITNSSTSSRCAAAVLRRLNRWENGWTLHDNPLHQMSDVPSSIDKRDAVKSQCLTNDDIPSASFHNHYYRRELVHRGLTVGARWQQQHQHQYYCGRRLNRANEVNSSFLSSVESLPSTLTETELKPLDDHFHQHNELYPRYFAENTASTINKSNPTSPGKSRHSVDLSSSKGTTPASASLPGSEDETTEINSKLAACYRQDGSSLEDNEVMISEHDLRSDVIHRAASSVGRPEMANGCTKREDSETRVNDGTLAHCRLKVDCNSNNSSIHDQSSPESSDSGIQTDCSGLLIDLPRLVSQLSRVSSNASSVGSINCNLEDNDDCSNNNNSNDNNQVNENLLLLTDIRDLWSHQRCQLSELNNMTSMTSHENKSSSKYPSPNSDDWSIGNTVAPSGEEVSRTTSARVCHRVNGKSSSSPWADSQRPLMAAASAARLQQLSCGGNQTVDSRSCLRARFAVRSLGWVPIDELDLSDDRCDRSVNRSVTELTFGRRDLNDVVGRWGDGKSLLLEVDDENLYLVDPHNLNALDTQPISSIRMWGIGRQDGRDFAFVARDDITRRYACHVFRCDGSARHISNELHQLCRRQTIVSPSCYATADHNVVSVTNVAASGGSCKNMNNRQVRATQKRATRPRSLPNLLCNASNMTNNDSNDNSLAMESTMVMRCRYVGMTRVFKSGAGVYLLDEAIRRLCEKVPRRQWMSVKVIVTQSTVTVLEHTKPNHVVVDCCIRFLSHVGVSSYNVRLFAFIIKCADDQFNGYVFYCEPSAAPLCNTVVKAWKTPRPCGCASEIIGQIRSIITYFCRSESSKRISQPDCVNDSNDFKLQNSW